MNNLAQISAHQAHDILVSAYPAKLGRTDPYGCLPEDLEYWAWPQVFGMTTGPFGGRGKQEVTTFTIEAWTDEYHAVLFCNGVVLKTVTKFEPMLYV